MTALTVPGHRNRNLNPGSDHRFRYGNPKGVRRRRLPLSDRLRSNNYQVREEALAEAGRRHAEAVEERLIARGPARPAAVVRPTLGGAV